MSRLANSPIKIPAGVNVSLIEKDGLNTVEISNGKVKEDWVSHKAVELKIEDSELVFSMSDENRADKFSRSMLGTDYRHIKNLIEGMVKPFEQVLEIHGLGYRVKLSGKTVVLTLGKSHEDIVSIPENVHVEVPGEREIVCRSHSKKLLGDFVSAVCSKRKPDAYKAKGVRIRGKEYRTKKD